LSVSAGMIDREKCSGQRPTIKVCCIDDLGDSYPNGKPHAKKETYNERVKKYVLCTDCETTWHIPNEKNEEPNICANCRFCKKLKK